MEQGWVYVLVNPSLPGLVKVGRTTRAPSTRVAELSQATGVATPFLLVFEQAFADCVLAERSIHGVLDRCGMRVAPNREFFRGPTTEIVRLVLQYASAGGEDGKAAAPLSGLELLQQGDAHLFGQGDTLQDLQAALRCYQLAAARGSVVAFERLGAIIAQTHGTTHTGRTRAMGYFKEGARRGNYFCYCEMASAAAEDRNTVNFTKAWGLFFLHRQSAWLAEAEEGPGRYPAALRRYILTCMALGLSPGHLPELRAEVNALITEFTNSLDQEVIAPAAHRMLTASLRWTKQTLIHRPYARRYSLALWKVLPQLAGRYLDATA